MADENNNVTLKVNGKTFGGWLEVSIAVKLMSLARGFAVKTTRSLRDERLMFDGAVGDQVEVFIGNDKVLTGYIRKTELAFSSSSLSMTITGASLTTDLSDCTLPPEAPKSYKGLRCAEIVSKVCSYLDVGVIDDVNGVDKTDADIEPTQTVGDFLVDFLKKHSLLLTDDEDGRLVVARAGKDTAVKGTLTIGKNVLSGDLTSDLSNRFARYCVIGQLANPDSEQSVSSYSMRQDAVDKAISRQNRVKVTKLDGSPSLKDLRNRAILLRDFGMATSTSIKVEAQGWRNNNGTLWAVNDTVRLDATNLIPELEGLFILSEVTYSLGASGTKTTLTLRDKNAFLVTDQKDKSKTTDSLDFSGIKKGSGKADSTKWAT